jgi:hypothetical protein
MSVFPVSNLVFFSVQVRGSKENDEGLVGEITGVLNIFDILHRRAEVVKLRLKAQATRKPNKGWG